MTKSYLLLLGLGAALIISRALIPGHGLTVAGAVEAFEHIGVGALLALCFVRSTRQPAVFALALATGFEVVMFLCRGAA